MTDYEDALNKMLEISNKELEEDNNNDGAYLNRGQVYFRRKDYRKAIDDFTKAIDLGLKFVNIYFMRGYSYFYIGEYIKAKNDYTKGLELDPNFENGNELMEELNYKIKATVYTLFIDGKNALRDGYIDSAIDLWEKSYTLSPDNIKLSEELANIYFYRGLKYYAIKNIPNALSDFERVLQLNKKKKKHLKIMSNIYHDIGIDSYKDGKKDDAINYLKKALEIYSKDKQTIKALTVICINTANVDYIPKEEYEKVMEYYNIALKYNPKDKKLLHNINIIKDQITKGQR